MRCYEDIVINKRDSKDEISKIVLFSGGAALDLNSVQPKPKKWILDATWLNLVRLSSLHSFKQITAQVASADKCVSSFFV